MNPFSSSLFSKGIADTTNNWRKDEKENRATSNVQANDYKPSSFISTGKADKTPIWRNERSCISTPNEYSSESPTTNLADIYGAGRLMGEQEKRVRAQAEVSATEPALVRQARAVTFNRPENQKPLFLNKSKLIRFLGERYDEKMTFGENLINAFRQNFFPTDRKVILDYIEFKLPESTILVLPPNVILRNNITVKSGALAFYEGEVLVNGRSAVIYACGTKTSVTVKAEATGARVIKAFPSTPVRVLTKNAQVSSFEEMQKTLSDVQAQYELGILGISGLYPSLCSVEDGMKHLLTAHQYGFDQGFVEPAFMLGELFSSPDWCAKKSRDDDKGMTGTELSKIYYHFAADKGHQGAKEKM